MNTHAKYAKKKGYFLNHPDVQPHASRRPSSATLANHRASSDATMSSRFSGNRSTGGEGLKDLPLHVKLA
jgi:hypothetical protein